MNTGTKLRASEQRQIQCEDLRRHLAPLEIGPLLNLFRAQAVDHFDGHFTILSFTNHFKAAFGTPSFDVDGRGDLEDLPTFTTLKEAVIDALVAVRTFYQEADRDVIRQHLIDRLRRVAEETKQ